MQGGEAIFILLKTGSSKAFIEGMNESWQSSEAYQGIYFSSIGKNCPNTLLVPDTTGIMKSTTPSPDMCSTDS